MAQPSIAPPLDSGFSEATQARFWAKVALPNEQGCMLWIGAKDINGYGKLAAPGHTGRAYYAHRVSYELANGASGAGTELTHSCGKRHCVAPLHLVLLPSRGTRGRASRQIKTHCKHGHEYTETNTYTYPSGERACRACRSRRRAAYRRVR